MKVPTAEVGDQRFGNLPDARQQLDAGPDNFLGETARAALGAGTDALERGNRAAAELYSQQMEAANRTRAQDAANQFQQAASDRLFGPAGAFNVKGGEVFSQADSLPLADHVRNDLQQTYQDIADGLGNDQQRELFAQHAQPLIERSYGQTLQHETEQYQAYRKSVNQQAIAAAGRDAVLNYNDPRILRAAAQRTALAGQDLARLDGAAAGLPMQVSGLVRDAFAAALQHGDAASAAGMLRDFAGELDADTLVDLRQRLQAADDGRNAGLIGDRVLAGFLPRWQQSPADRAFNILLQSESAASQRDGQGQVAASPAGALGIAQLLPATARETAAELGLAWDERRFRDDADYNRQLGRAYFARQLRDFKGDLPLAYAAYNAGPGRVRQALAATAATGGDWLAQMPAETRAYVAGNMRAFAAGAGAQPEPSLAEVAAAADSSLRGQYGEQGTPGLRRLVLAHVEQGYHLQRQAQQQRREQAVAEAMRGVQQNGGDYAALPAAVRAEVPPERVDDVMAYARNIGRGSEPVTDWDLYYRLRRNRLLLKNTDLMAYRDRLGDTEFKQLTDLQRGNGGQPPATQLRTADDILRGFMTQAGINPDPGPGDPQGAATVGRIWAAYEQRVAEFESLHGRKAGSQELEKVAAQLFTRVPVRWLLFGSRDKPAVLVDRHRDAVLVPADERRQIEAAWQQAHPGAPLSDDQVFVAYLRRKGLL